MDNGRFKMADQVEYRYSQGEMEAMMAMASRSNLFFPDSASTVEAAKPQEFDKEFFWKRYVDSL